MKMALMENRYRAMDNKYIFNQVINAKHCYNGDGLLYRNGEL